MSEEERDEEMASPTKQVEGCESDRENENQNKDYASKIRKALFAAVEDGYDNDFDDEGRSLLSHRPLIRLFVPNSTNTIKPGATARELKEIILESVQNFHKGYARRFFSGIKPILEHLIQEELYIPESAFEGEDKSQVSERSIAPEAIIPDARSSEALQFLLYTTNCLQAYLNSAVEKRASSRKSLSGQQPVPIIAEVCEVAQMLHNLLFELHGCGPDAIPVQSALLNLCESWWHSSASQAELLVPATLTLLAYKALGMDDKWSQQSDIKRLLKMQDAFHLIEWDDESSTSLRSLLQKLMSNPLCLKTKEGKRLLSGLFLVDANLLTDLHQAIRIQIPQAKKPILSAFGEIYKRAWKDSQHGKIPEEIQHSIEEHVLQDLMYAVLHLQSSRMTKALLVILEPFHEAKKSPEIEDLLYRMYGPILWRALSAANSSVRINATIVFGEVFPLQEPSLAQPDVALHRGVEKLKALLQDKCYKVRVASSETVAKVMTTFWDVLATEDIRSLLNHIVARHASDASSYQVRAAALKAVTSLLDAPQSHAVLRALLPSLGNLIHDTNKSVRLEAVRMLLKIKAIKGIKYYHVVPVDHLKARLVAEGAISGKSARSHNPLPLQSDVASGLTRLMLNSYVPQGPNVSAVDQIKRTLSFLSTDPEAAAVFYANVADHLPTSSVAKLAAMLLRCLTSAVETEQKNQEQKQKNTSKRKRNHGSGSESDPDDNDSEEESDDEDTFLTASNTTLMASLAEAIASLWDSIHDDLEYDDDETCRKFLLDSFSGTVLTDMLSYFEQRTLDDSSEVNILPDSMREECYRVCAALLRCASLLDPKDVKGMVGHISSSLKDLSSPTGFCERELAITTVSNHMALLCLWGMADDVATCLASSISNSFRDGHVENLSVLSPHSDISKKRKNGRSNVPKGMSSGDHMLPNLPAAIAVGVLGDVLRGSNPSNIAARERLIENANARQVLEAALAQGISYAGGLMRMASDRTQTLDDSHVELVIRTCEAFGRFALHKAALSAVEGSSIQLNQEAKQLLEWTTEQVIPAIQNAHNGSSLQDLDISRISFVNDSMISFGTRDSFGGTAETPGLLSPVAPPRKKGNRNATPERVDGSFIAFTGNSKSKRKDSKIIPGDSALLLVRSASFSLLQTSCMMFSEWLTVTDGAGCESIHEAALKWCSVLASTNDLEGKENSRNDEHFRKQIQRDLFPAFARLAVAIGRTTEQLDLVQQLILCSSQIGDDFDENESENIEVISSVVQTMVSTLLKGWAAEKTVKAILEVAYKSITEETNSKDKTDNAGGTIDTEMSIEMPASMHEALFSPEHEYCMGSAVLATALSAIVSNKAGSAVLARQLVEKFDFYASTCRNPEEKENFNKAEMDVLLFEAKCLYLLSANCKSSLPVREALRKLSEFDLPANDFVRHIMQEVVESCYD